MARGVEKDGSFAGDGKEVNFTTKKCTPIGTLFFLKLNSSAFIEKTSRCENDQAKHRK
jgi:hypothetical protein